MKKTLLITSSAFALVAAQANTVSYTTNFPSSLTDWSTSLGIHQFDTSLGTLVSADVQLSSSMSTSMTVTNDVNAGGSSSGYVKTELTVSLAPNTLGLLNTNNPSYASSSPFNNYDYTTTMDYLSSKYSFSSLAPGGTTSGGGTGSQTVDSGTINDSPTLAELTGSGFYDLGVYTTTYTSLNVTGGNAGAYQTTDGSLSVTVTYTFDPAPTPEPSTFAMIGAGVAGLGLTLRRRMAK